MSLPSIFDAPQASLRKIRNALDEASDTSRWRKHRDVYDDMAFWWSERAADMRDAALEDAAEARADYARCYRDDRQGD